MNASNNPEKEDDPHPIAVYIFFSPIVIVAVIFLVIGWFLARAGAKYGTVKLTSWVSAIIVSNIFGVGILLSTFVFGVSFSTMADFTLYFIWGPFLNFMWGIVLDQSIPKDLPHMWPAREHWVWICAYQYFLAWAFGQRFARHFAMSLYDAAIVRIAIAAGKPVNDIRREVIKNDYEYVQDALIYQKRQTGPLMGFLLVHLAGASWTEYYTSLTITPHASS